LALRGGGPSTGRSWGGGSMAYGKIEGKGLNIRRSRGAEYGVCDSKTIF